jgi:hypothetical protein
MRIGDVMFTKVSIFLVVALILPVSDLTLADSLSVVTTPAPVPNSLSASNKIAASPNAWYQEYWVVNEHETLSFVKDWGRSGFGEFFDIKTDSNPPGSPPGIPSGSSMPWAFGYNQPITSTFTWTPSYCQASSIYYTFNILEYTDYNLVDFYTEYIRVNNVNRPPTLTTSFPSVKYLAVGANWLQSLSGTDPDMTECGDDSITMSYSSSPGISATITNQGGGNAQFNWSPTSTGPYAVTFRAQDANSAFDEKTVEVWVFQPAGTSNFNVNEDQFLTFQRSITVPIGETAQIEPVQPNLPLGATFAEAQGTTSTSSTFGWTPNTCAGRVPLYTFQVKYFGSGSVFDTETINIEVADVNRPPSFQTSLPSVKSLSAGTRWLQNLQGTDPDKTECNDDPLTMNYSVTPGPVSATIVDSGNGRATFDWTPLTSEVGTHTLTFKVRDSHGASNQKQVTAVVSCCSGLTGNVDCDPGDGVDISDLSAMIDHLYISFTPLCCKAEANVDGSVDGNIDISDLSALIDYLYISFTPPAACQ